MKKKLLVTLLCMVFVATTVLAGCGGGSEESAVNIGGELNLLCWTGYDEDPIVQAFEEKYGVTVNVKTFSNSSELYAILETAEEGEWDVVTPDTPWIGKMVDADMLQPLDMSKYTAVKDYFDYWKDFEEVKVDGEQYGIVTHWGYYGVAYNTEEVTEKEAQSMDILWDSKYKGKVGIYDWYLPNMEMISIYNGNKKPVEINDSQFKDITKKLDSLAKQDPIICASPSDLIQSFANGSTVVAVAGEWMQISMQADGYPIDITIPESGALSWAECVSIVKGTKNQEAAEAYVDYITSPEAQALLAWADCYHAPVPNQKAADYLTDDQKAAFKIYDKDYADYVFSHLIDRQLPADEDKWSDAWTKFKSDK